MKVKENVINKEKIIQIYLTEDEKNDFEIQKKIEFFKNSHKVVLFVSGREDVKKNLNEIIKIIAN